MHFLTSISAVRLSRTLLHGVNELLRIYILIIIFWYVQDTSVIGRETVANKGASKLGVLML